MSTVGMFTPPDREEALRNQKKFLDRAQTFITIGVDKDGCIGLAGHFAEPPQMATLLSYVEDEFAKVLKSLMKQQPMADQTFFKIDKDVEIVDFKPKLIGGET